jgi:hypothetical protein
MAQLIVEGTIGSAMAVRSLVGSDPKIDVNYGSWGTPVYVRSENLSDLIPIKQLLEEAGAKCRLVP